MKEKFLVEGANWTASIIIDTSLFDQPHMEAATRAFEYAFKDGPDSELSDEFDLKVVGSQGVGLGLIVSTVRDSEKHDEEKYIYIRTKVVAENAGLLEVSRMMTEIEKGINARSKQDFK